MTAMNATTMAETGMAQENGHAVQASGSLFGELLKIQIYLTNLV
jgi:hypothetical protein